jgi:hypothetical protein
MEDRMYGKKRFCDAISLTILLIVAITLLTGCGSNASAISIQCGVTGEPQADHYQVWTSSDGQLHFRDGVIQFSCTSNDERFQGDWMSTTHFDGDPITYSGMYSGLFWINDSTGKHTWEGVGHSYMDQSGNSSGLVTFYGRDKYEGLQVQLELSKANSEKEYTFQGDVSPIEK